MVPRLSFGLRSPSTARQKALGQDMGSRPRYEENSGARVVSVILGHPLGHCNDEEGASLHHLINSPTHSDSSTGSCSPYRGLFMIDAPSESELKRRQDNKLQRQEDEAERQRLEQEAAHELARNCVLQARG